MLHTCPTLQDLFTIGSASLELSLFSKRPCSYEPRMDWNTSTSSSGSASETVSGLFTGFEESSSGRVMSRGAGHPTDPPLPCSATSAPPPLLLSSDHDCSTS